MRQWVVVVLLAAVSLLVASCTGNSQPSARLQPRTATRSVPGGPGPSIINLPAPGCWTLHLTWSGHTDELKLRYTA
jgi:hypothetical protein